MRRIRGHAVFDPPADLCMEVKLILKQYARDTAAFVALAFIVDWLHAFMAAEDVIQEAVDDWVHYHGAPTRRKLRCYLQQVAVEATLVAPQARRRLDSLEATAEDS